MSDRDDDSRDDERPSADGAPPSRDREALGDQSADASTDQSADASTDQSADASTDQSADAGTELDEEAESKMRDLLRGALDLKKEEPPPDSAFLRGVQKRLRDRSGGKFYADGWSTAKHPPTYTYLWTSVLMLAIVVAVYATLTSLVGEAADVENQPAPVQIVFPKSR